MRIYFNLFVHFIIISILNNKQVKRFDILTEN